MGLLKFWNDTPYLTFAQLLRLSGFYKNLLYRRITWLIEHKHLTSKDCFIFEFKQYGQKPILYLAGEVPPPDIMSYPYKSIIESGKPYTLKDLMGTEGEKKSTHFRYVNMLVEQGLIPTGYDAVEKPPQKADKDGQYAEAYRGRWPLAHRWLIEQVKGRYAE